MLIPYGEWRPDVADLNTEFAANILNVLPAAGSYTPFPLLVSFTSAVPETPLGKPFTAFGANGGIYQFVGTATKLWLLNANTLTWTDVSRSTGGAYGANDITPWDFAQFGNFVVAVNQNDDPQVFQIGTSSVFAALGGSPPRAGIVKVWGDFLALMNLTTNPRRVQWSGLNNIVIWTPGTQNSDYQDFPDGGKVQGSTESTNPFILLERAIYAGTFVPGSSEIFTFSKIHDKRGAKAPLSIASRGAYTFYADSDGFFQLGPDGSVLPIGFMKVDKTIFNAMSRPTSIRMIGVVDPFFPRVYWAIPNDISRVFNQVVAYDWELQKWSQASASITALFSTATIGYTLETLSDAFPNIETVPFSFDSPVWEGGAVLLGAFTSDNKLGFFNGQNMEATLETQEMGDTSGGVTTVLSAYPVVDTQTLFVSIGSRLRRSDARVYTAEQAPSSKTGRVRKRSRGRFHRARTRIPASTAWTHAQGVDIETVKSGER